MLGVRSVRVLVVASLVFACSDDDGGGSGGATTTGSTTTGGDVTMTTIPVTSETLDTTISASEGTTDDASTDGTVSASSEDTRADDTSGAVCGDGVIEDDEDCDGDQLGGHDCTTIEGDFLGGELACGGSCSFDTGACIPGPALDVEFCRLQHPLLIEAPAGSIEVVYGRVYVEGVTDQTTGTDAHPALGAWVGYGPEDGDPSVDDSGWTWIEAAPNPGYDEEDELGEQNNDEYWVDLTVPAPGVYAFAFRFSGDLGQTFVHCDGDEPGNTNGYDPTEAGRMTSTQR
jgi:hypothetical protein